MEKILVGAVVGGALGAIALLMEKGKKNKFDYLVQQWPDMHYDQEMLKIMDSLYPYQAANTKHYKQLGDAIEKLIQLQVCVKFEIGKAKRHKENYVRFDVNYPLSSAKYVNRVVNILEKFSLSIIEYNSKTIQEKRIENPFFNRYSEEAAKITLSMEEYKTQLAPIIEKSCISHMNNILYDDSILSSHSIFKGKEKKKDRKPWDFIQAISDRIKSTN